MDAAGASVVRHTHPIALPLLQFRGFCHHASALHAELSAAAARGERLGQLDVAAVLYDFSERDCPSVPTPQQHAVPIAVSHTYAMYCYGGDCAPVVAHAHSRARFLAHPPAPERTCPPLPTRIQRLHKELRRQQFPVKLDGSVTCDSARLLVLQFGAESTLHGFSAMFQFVAAALLLARASNRALVEVSGASAEVDLWLRAPEAVCKGAKLDCFFEPLSACKYAAAAAGDFAALPRLNLQDLLNVLRAWFRRCLRSFALHGLRHSCVCGGTPVAAAGPRGRDARPQRPWCLGCPDEYYIPCLGARVVYLWRRVFAGLAVVVPRR